MSNKRFSIHVKNLSPNVNEAELQAKFGEFGPVKDVYLPKHRNTGRRKMFGFVEMTSQADMELAIQKMNQTTLDGNLVTCEVAQEDRKSSVQMRERDGRRGRRRSRSPPRRKRDRSRGRRRSPSPDRRRKRDDLGDRRRRERSPEPERESTRRRGRSK